MIFKFRMLSDENDHFVREYEVPGDMTLLDLHRFLVRSLQYRDDGMASLFTSDKDWNRVREFTLVDMGGEGEAVPMADVTLGQVVHHDRDRLIYLFDMMGDRAYYLESTEAFVAAEGVKYPRVAFGNAPAPDQYEPSSGAAEGSIFDDVMDEFSDFEGDE